MKNISRIYTIVIFTFFSFLSMEVSAQHPQWEELPKLPDSLGFAGMFAGVSKGNIFCMGGANFPNKKPWEGGTKVWYDRIFMFKDGRWRELKEKMPRPNGYGVSVSYKDRIILVGGNNEKGYSDQVISCFWDGQKLVIENLPKLPVPLSNMCGTLVGDLIIVAGGNSSPTSDPLSICLVLDLTYLKKGWIALDPIPGPGRILPVCGVVGEKYYLFSGENTLINNTDTKYRHILQDAYCLSVTKSSSTIKGEWQKLAIMPKGVSACPSPLPFVPDFGFVFWGGVDAVTALWKDPASHPGISSEVIAYQPVNDTWSSVTTRPQDQARVTLPVVNWNNRWVYISGEVRPGIRTNKNYSVK